MEARFFFRVKVTRDCCRLRCFHVVRVICPDGARPLRNQQVFARRGIVNILAKGDGVIPATRGRPQAHKRLDYRATAVPSSPEPAVDALDIAASAVLLLMICLERSQVY